MIRSEQRRRHLAAFVIQRAWLDYVIYCHNVCAACAIQRVWRGGRTREVYVQEKLKFESVLAIQSSWRRYCEYMSFQESRRSAILIQSIWRAYVGRQEMSALKWRAAAITVQRFWRGFSAQVNYQMDLMDIILVQSLARRRFAKRHRERRLHSIDLLQGAMRCALARKAVSQMTKEKQQREHHNMLVVRSQVRNGKQTTVLRLWRVSFRPRLFVTVCDSNVACQKEVA